MVTVYITAPTETAANLAELLVEERLAACVNLVDCSSVYRWEGDVITEPETILLAKTTDQQYPTLCERVLEEHPHEVPCIERFDEDGALEAFSAWRETATTPE
jgi:periplasmic divalent cation tolerance protein